MRRCISVALLAIALLTIVLGAGSITAPAASASPAAGLNPLPPSSALVAADTTGTAAIEATCVARFTVFPGGFVASVTLTNIGAVPLAGWVVTFTQPANMQVTQFWNANATISGRKVALANAGWNAAVAPGGSVNFGFAGTYTGTFVPPDDMNVNGVPCTVIVD
ncbi:MAG: cellulose binding domain-containing protein [Micromonosporaceae bacterium]|nr:cellulose binding domain-containing protein [Micromonosporaceae bacterium]